MKEIAEIADFMFRFGFDLASLRFMFYEQVLVVLPMDSLCHVETKIALE